MLLGRILVETCLKCIIFVTNSKTAKSCWRIRFQIHLPATTGASARPPCTLKTRKYAKPHLLLNIFGYSICSVISAIQCPLYFEPLFKIASVSLVWSSNLSPHPLLKWLLYPYLCCQCLGLGAMFWTQKHFGKYIEKHSMVCP